MAQDDKPEKTVIVTLKSEAAKPSAQEPFLVAISGRETGKAIPLKQRHLKVGREPDCDIVIDSPQISRHHAELLWENSQLKIKDLGSTNGVFVNGQKVQESFLHNGDKILFGNQMYFKIIYQDTVDQNYQQSLFKAATTDALTGLYNKRYFMELLEKEFSYSRRSFQNLSLILMDIDHFKQINDTYGHIAGDKILKSLGQLLSSQIRLENTACRFGGEEFALILRGASSQQACLVADRLRTLIAQRKVMGKSKEIHFTVSLGVATFNGNNFANSEEFLMRADELLYSAKQRGRNQFVSEAA